MMVYKIERITIYYNPLVQQSGVNYTVDALDHYSLWILIISNEIKIIQQGYVKCCNALLTES